MCGLGGTVDNRTGVTILQHPGERHHAFNTARLARAVLQNAALHITWPDADGALVHRGPVPPGTALLYPRHDAVELAAIPAADRPRHLVVIDGTWAQARTVYRDNPWLDALPHVQLTPAEPSRYRIRREPAPHCLSTIESIAQALTVLEPDTVGLDGLLDGFRAMVDTQADQTVERVRRRKVRLRPSVIERLATEWDRVVVGYAESVGLKDRGGVPALVQWAAVRPATGEVFEAQIALDQGLTPGQQHNTGLDPSRAGPVERFVADWNRFAGDGVVVASWSPKAVPLLDATTGGHTEAISLRSAYGNLRAGVLGYLDEVTDREGCVVVPLDIAGRAGQRLGYAVALATFLKDQHR